jgi:hypothetical protein
MVVLIKVLVDTHATGCKTQQLNIYIYIYIFTLYQFHSLPRNCTLLLLLTQTVPATIPFKGRCHWCQKLFRTLSYNRAETGEVIRP